MRPTTLSLFRLLILVSLATVLFTWVGKVPTAQTFSPVACGNSVIVNMSTATTAELVALSGTRRVHVCGFSISGGGATTLQFKTGTGTTCGTGMTNRTGALELADNSSISYGSGVGVIFRSAAGEALCVTNAQAVQVSGVVTYGQF